MSSLRSPCARLALIPPNGRPVLQRWEWRCATTASTPRPWCSPPMRGATCSPSRGVIWHVQTRPFSAPYRPPRTPWSCGRTGRLDASCMPRPPWRGHAIACTPAASSRPRPSRSRQSAQPASATTSRRSARPLPSPRRPERGLRRRRSACATSPSRGRERCSRQRWWPLSAPPASSGYAPSTAPPNAPSRTASGPASTSSRSRTPATRTSVASLPACLRRLAARSRATTAMRLRATWRRRSVSTPPSWTRSTSMPWCRPPWEGTRMPCKGSMTGSGWEGMAPRSRTWRGSAPRPAAWMGACWRTAWPTSSSARACRPWFPPSCPRPMRVWPSTACASSRHGRAWASTWRCMMTEQSSSPTSTTSPGART